MSWAMGAEVWVARMGAVRGRGQEVDFGGRPTSIDEAD